MKRILFALAFLAIPFTANAQMTPGDIPTTPTATWTVTWGEEQARLVKVMSDRMAYLGQLRNTFHACEYMSMFYSIETEAVQELTDSTIKNEDLTKMLHVFYNQTDGKKCVIPEGVSKIEHINAMGIVIARETRPDHR